jgi:hypothetical protein
VSISVLDGRFMCLLPLGREGVWVADEIAARLGGNREFRPRLQAGRV